MFAAGLGTNRRSDWLAVAEQGDGGDALDAVAAGDVRVGVDVDLDDLQVGAVGGERLEFRGDEAAGTAPGGPEVDNDRHGRVEDLGLEALGIVSVDNSRWVSPSVGSCPNWLPSRHIPVPPGVC